VSVIIELRSHKIETRREMLALIGLLVGMLFYWHDFVITR
jgi:hypothetical protein